MELLHLALLFGVGCTAGFINVNAGGGSSLTLPTLIFLGLDGALANGTNRVAILIQNIFAVASFHKKEFHEYKTSGVLSLFTLPGAAIGALAASRISSDLFEKILAGVLVLIVISMFFSRIDRNSRGPKSKNSNWLIYPAMFGLGFYGGFLQIGIGFLLMASLYHLLHIDLITVNMHKVFIVLIYTIPALLVFVLTGNVNWKFGLILAAGNALGGWWGAHAAVRGGEKVIRAVLAAAIAIMALKLFGAF